MYEQSNILEEAGNHIFELFRNKLSPYFVYHNYQHTIDTVVKCRELAKAYDEISKEDLEILLIAAWFHDAGYIQTKHEHEEYSKKIAKNFLSQRNFGKEKTEAVLQCIESTKKHYKPTTLISKIIADANIADIGQETYHAKASLLRSELSKFGKIFPNDNEWIKAQLDFLQFANFHTEEAERLFGEQGRKTIEELKNKSEKIKEKEKKKKKKDLAIKDPRPGIQTMFRSIYRSHINLSSIADDKANMMIRVNSMIISIALTLVGAKFSFLGTSFKENQIVIYPIMTLLLTGLFAIIFAILSAKPTITHKIHRVADIKDKSASILFFGNFRSINLDEYKAGMQDLIKNKDDIYDSMMTDLYCLGKVLTKKYQLIKISYLIFMAGLIITALITILVVIHLKKAVTSY